MENSWTNYNPKSTMDPPPTGSVNVEEGGLTPILQLI